MNNRWTISQRQEDSISFYHLLAFLVTLPFDRFYSQLVLVSFLIHTLLHCRKQGLYRLWSWQNLVLTSVILLNIAGMIYSPDKGQAGKDIQRQLAILIFPITFSLSNFPFAQYRRKLMLGFSIACVFVILYLYIDALRIIRYNGLPLSTLWSQLFINHNFSSPLDMHATFLSLYAALSMVFLASEFIEAANKRFRMLYLLGTLILAVGLLQLASRSILIALAISTACLPFFIQRGRKRMQFLVLALMLALLAVLGIMNIDSFRKRYVAALRDDLTQASINNEMLEPRIVRWKLAWQLVQEKMVLGYGSGTEKRILKDAYYRNKLYNSYLHELNAHNQYLSIWLKTGLAGLLVFLLSLLFGFREAKRNKDSLFFFFMVLASVIAFSENLLDVNKGIFFYAFFFSFFIVTGKPNRAISRLEQQN